MIIKTLAFMPRKGDIFIAFVHLPRISPPKEANKEQCWSVQNKNPLFWNAKYFQNTTKLY